LFLACCYAGHCFARAPQCPAFRLVRSASGVVKVSASRASVRALERCHRRHASLRIVLSASPARWRRHPLKHRAHVPGRAPSSPVGQGPGLRAPSHRRSLDHHPPPPTTGTCAGHCSASAPQCPATERRAPVHHPPPPASARAQASHAAQWHRPVHTVPQAPRCGPVGTTEPLRGPPPSQFPVHEPYCCAGHCFARAQQCPAFRLFWSASGIGKVSAPRASVRALERCHQWTRLASPRVGGLACALLSPPSRAPRPCAGPRPIVTSWPRSRPARPGTSALRGPRPATADTTGTCAGHCRAGARQCPATETAAPVNTRLNPARSKVCAQRSARRQRFHHARPPAATARAPPPPQPPQSGCAQAPYAYSCDADPMTFGQWI